MYFIEEPKTLDVSMDNYGVKGADPYLFERLTMFDADDVLIPGAADSWEPSADGRAPGPSIFGRAPAGATAGT